jgi:hypothetical protein
VLFVTWYTEPVFRVRVILSLSCVNHRLHFVATDFLSSPAVFFFLPPHIVRYLAYLCCFGSIITIFGAEVAAADLLLTPPSSALIVAVVASSSTGIRCLLVDWDLVDASSSTSACSHSSTRCCPHRHRELTMPWSASIGIGAGSQSSFYQLDLFSEPIPLARLC